MSSELGPAWASEDAPAIVEASGGRRIQCWTFSPGVSAVPPARIVNAQWIFQNEHGRRIAGPPAHTDQTMDELRGFVEKAIKRGDL